MARYRKRATLAELEGYRQEQLDRPTRPERAVAAALDALGVAYEPQRIIAPYIVDFWLPDSRTVLEVHGCYWHACSRGDLNGTTPLSPS
jgi:G:T-mismatch repair DNA endonuclease (very short patch repair protein)